MKRIVKLLVLVMVMLMPITFASAKKTTTTTEAIVKDGTPVKLYVFYGSTCSHCADLHTFLSELETDKDYNFMFEVVDYEVWSDTTNATLMQNTAKALNTTASGVPFYVVGTYYSSGFPNPEANADRYKEDTDKLKEEIKKAYIEANKENSTYVDIVATVGEGHTANSSTNNKDNDIVGYILLGITIIIIVAIVFGRSSTKEDFESDIKAAMEEEKVEAEEVKEPVKKVATKKTAAKKAPAKKATAKKTTTTKKTTSTKKTSTAKKTTTKKNK